MECPHEKTDADSASALTCGHTGHPGSRHQLLSADIDNPAKMPTSTVEELPKHDAQDKIKPINRDIAAKWRVSLGANVEKTAR